MQAEILVAKDLTSAQRKDVRSYEAGDHVTFPRGSRAYGVEAGALGRVIEADAERSRLSVQLDDGGVVTYEPRRLCGADVARVERRELSKGDRIEFRQPDRAQGIVNGQLGEVVALDERRRRARVRLDGPARTVTVDLSRAQALDLGYASTSYRSQGRTVDHVIDLQDSRIASREGFYVGTSRGRESITVVTDEHDALVRRLERAITPEPSALDVERMLSPERTAREASERRPPALPTRLRVADLPAPTPLRDLIGSPESELRSWSLRAQASTHRARHTALTLRSGSMTTHDEIAALLAAPEGARLEFKAARGGFHFEELVKYVVALANEGGGAIVFGVEDERPRRVVGTTAFQEPGRTEAGLYEQLHQRITLEEHVYEGQRLLIARVPARLAGTAWQYRGTFWMRAGDALLPMSDEQLRHIHNEGGPDFSAEPCSRASLSDLDEAAVALLRRLWGRKSLDLQLAEWPLERLLTNAELLVDGELTHAALILLGTREALGRHLGHAEVVFEYRSSDAPGPAADRQEFRHGFLTILDALWDRIALRNDMQHFQHRLFVWDIPTFDERAVREAVLNAVSHRDYRNGASVFVRQFPRRIEIVSPGGFPSGITAENVLWQQKPRNRRIADVLARCGLVERAGQGFDLIYRECIRQGKRLPDLARTDAHWVCVTLHGEIADPEFLRFLEEIGQERLLTFSTDDFLAIDCVHRDVPVPEAIEPRVQPLLDEGILERIGRGRGARLLLSQRFYRRLGKAGVYTRKRGLDHETNKALLLQHIRNAGTAGCPISELQQVLPALARDQVKRLLGELRSAGQVQLVGARRGARWVSK